jgi:voltage-gated potassium channel
MSFDESRVNIRRDWTQLFLERRFGVLLVIVLGLIIGPPILLGFGIAGGWFDGIVSLLVLAAICWLCFERRGRVFVLLFGIPSVLFSLGGHALAGTVSLSVLFVGHLCQASFLFGAAVLIVKAIIETRSITLDSVSGAVCGYLFLGLGWAVTCAMIETVSPGSYKINESLVQPNEQSRSMQHVLTYYSFVTLTTLGYGDVTPVSPTARTFAWIEAGSGQFYLAVIVAGLVSMLATSPDRLPNGRKNRFN